MSPYVRIIELERKLEEDRAEAEGRLEAQRMEYENRLGELEVDLERKKKEVGVKRMRIVPSCIVVETWAYIQ